MSTQWKGKAKVGDRHARTTTDLVTLQSRMVFFEIRVDIAIMKPFYLLIKFGDKEIKDVKKKRDLPHKGGFPKVTEIILNCWGRIGHSLLSFCHLP